jgi:molybdopterin-containing oxidoreductase family iron-sulfur binding subunit
MHCGASACVEVCPTGASMRRPDGIVIVDSTKCTGCLNCLVACPYGARQIYPENGRYFPAQETTPYEEACDRKYTGGVVSKCNFCLPRIEKGLQPACIENCMTKARYFGDLDDPYSEVSQLIRDRDGFQVYPTLTLADNQTQTSRLSVMSEIHPSVYYLSP